MGRDKPKKYNKMGYLQQQNYIRQQGAKYNINPDDFENHAHGGGRFEDFDQNGYTKAVENAMRNDFDYRTSAQHMDGIEGDASASDFVNYQRGAHKLHKKAGNGGEYSSNKDITGVTNNLVNDYRSGLQDQITSMGNATDEGSVKPYEAPEPGLSWNEAKENGTLSDQAQENDKAINDYKDYQTGGDESDDRYTQARAFDYLKDYKLDLTKEYGA